MTTGGATDGDMWLVVALCTSQTVVGVCVLARAHVRAFWARCSGTVSGLFHREIHDLLSILSPQSSGAHRTRSRKTRVDSFARDDDENAMKRKRSLSKESGFGGSGGNSISKRDRDREERVHFDNLVGEVFSKQKELLHSNVIKHTVIAEREFVTAYRASLRNSTFTSHVRSEQNFVRNNDDASLRVPPKGTPERAMYTIKAVTLLNVLWHSKPVAHAVKDACGLAFLAGAAASAVWYAHIASDTASKLIVVVEKSLAEVLVGYRFFPAFLLLGLLTYIVERWRDFLTNCHTVQARLHDIGVAVGAAIVDPSSLRVRKKLYTLYRYMNVAHAKTYASVCAALPQSSQACIAYRLLTEEEVNILEAVENKSRDVVITWIGAVIEDLIRSNDVRELSIHSMLVPELRGICARHMDLFTRNMPNVWFATCHVIVNYLVILQTLYLSVQLDPAQVIESGETSDHREVLFTYVFCNWVFSFMLASTYWVASSMVEVLATPFGYGDDAYNADALLASTDRMLFASLRAKFNLDAADEGARRRNARRRWWRATMEYKGEKHLARSFDHDDGDGKSALSSLDKNGDIGFFDVVKQL